MSVRDASFVGSIPALYDRCLGPTLFAPYAEDLARRTREGAHRVLEIAAGTGIVTRALHAALPAATIVATDLNEAMLAHAARRLAVPNVTWRQADATTLPFADGSFDLVVCQFGAMFFPVRTRAFREAYRVLEPGGQFLLNLWASLDHNEIPRIVSRAVAAAFPDDPPAFVERVPHGHGDSSVTAAELRASAFSHVDVEIVTLPSRAAAAADPAIGLCQGTPLRMEIEARDAGRLTEVTAAAARALAQRFGNGPLEAPMCANVFEATR